MADFKVNDIIQDKITQESTKYIYSKYLVTKVFDNAYDVLCLTGANRKQHIIMTKFYANKTFKVIAHFTPKQDQSKKVELKPNCYVKILNARNKDNIGKTAKVISFINPAIKFGNDYDDCLIQIENSPHHYHIPKSWLERIPKPNRPQKGNFTKEEVYAPLFKIEMNGNKVIAKRIKEFGIDDDNKRIIIKKQEDFEARCHKKDTYDEETGVLIAIARAYNDKLLEYYALNQDKFENILDLIKFVSEEKNDK